MSTKTDSKVNPQPENGHIDIANEIAEELARTNLSAYESRVLWAVWRKTWGWHKKEDWISLEQLRKMTKITNKGHLSRTVSKLLNRNILFVKRGSGKTIMGFQKQYNLWDSPIIKEINWDNDARPWYFKPGKVTRPGTIICELCKKEVSQDLIEDHHIIPKSWGGPDSPHNKTFICYDCHKKLHNEFKKNIGDDPLRVPVEELSLYYIELTLQLVKNTKYEQSSSVGVPIEELPIEAKGSSSMGTEGVPIEVKESSSVGTFSPSNQLSPSQLETPKETTTKETKLKETTTKEKKHSGQKNAHENDSEKVLQIHQFLVEQFKKLYERKYKAPYVETKKDFVMSARLLKSVDIKEAERRLKNAFMYNYWFDVKTFGQFSAHFNDLTEQPKDKFSGIRDWLKEKEQEVQNEQERR